MNLASVTSTPSITLGTFGPQANPEAFPATKTALQRNHPHFPHPWDHPPKKKILPSHCYNPKTKHHQITRTSFNDSTMAWQKSPQISDSSLISRWVGSTVGVTWIRWSCCGVAVKHWIEIRMCLDWKIIGWHRYSINIMVSTRYNFNLKNLQQFQYSTILQLKIKLIMRGFLA